MNNIYSNSPGRGKNCMLLERFGTNSFMNPSWLLTLFHSCFNALCCQSDIDSP